MKKIVQKSAIIAAVLASTCVACQIEQEPPLPAANLSERNKALVEVKKQLAALERANEAEALELLTHRDHRVRRRAAGRLGMLQKISESSVSKLTEGLDDEHPLVRIAVASALSDIGTEQAIEALVKALVDPDYKVRLWAFKGLVSAKEESVPILLRHLSSDSPLRALHYTDSVGQRHDIHELLVDCLSKIGKPAVPALVKVLPNENLMVRQHVAVILGNIGRDAAEAIHVLLEIANSEEHIELRKKALTAIGQIGDVDPEVTPTLVGMSHGDNKIIARAASRVLKELEKNARNPKKK